MASITIPLFYDLDLLRFTTAAGGIALQPNLVLGQSDEIDFAVQFVQGGVGINLPPITSIICGIKPINDVSGDYLASTTSFTQAGSGATRVYTFTLLLDSVELRAWLLTVTATSNYAAFSILSAEHKIATLPAITCTILPDYNLTGTTPTAASGTLIVDSGQTFTVHKSFAMPVDDGTDTYILQTNGSGVGSWVAKPSGGVTSVGQSFTGGIVQVSGTPVTSTGTLALTISGQSGGLVYFSSTSAWASSAVMGAGALVVGGGAGATPTALAAVASGRVLTSAGTSTTPAYSSTITLGASGTLGTITLGNATSGTILITPPTGALGTPTLTLPITATTLAGLSVVQTFNAAQTFSSTVSLTLDTDATSSTVGGTLTVTGGAAVSRKLFVGSLLDIVATTSTAGRITQAGTNLLHTYGTDNLFLGGGAGNTTNTGFYSVGIGTRSLFSLTGGRQNLCFGWQAGYYITTGWDNTIFGGYNTGLGISTGSGNLVVGAGADITNGNYRGAIGAYSSCTADDTIVIGKVAGTYNVNGTPGSRSADNVIIPGLLTANGGVTIASGKALKLGNAAVTGLTAGVLAATTNASITITDSNGTVYRIPCIV